MDILKEKIRHVPDFPKAGILFYDITTLLRDPEGFRTISTGWRSLRPGIDVVVGIESRGFILGAAVADRIGAASRRSASRGSCRRDARESYALDTGPTRSRSTTMR